MNGPLSSAGIKLSANVNGSATGFMENVDKYEDPSVGTKIQGRTACGLAAGIEATVGVPIPAVPVIKFVFGGSANATFNLTETIWTYDDSKAPADRHTITDGTISGKLTLSGKIGVQVDMASLVVGELGANVSGGGTFQGKPTVGNSGVITVSGQAALQPIMANCYGKADVKIGPFEWKLVDWTSTMLTLWSPTGDGVPYTFTIPLLPPV